MAFTLEDGTGVAGANAYIDAAGVTTYLTDRGRETAWSALVAPAQQVAIIKASDYMEKRWGKQYKGIKFLLTQGLGWPRSDAFDSDGNEFASDALPVQLLQAAAEYAVRASIADLMFDPAVTDGQQSVPIGGIKKIKEKVGDLEVETEYQDANNERAGAPSGVSGNNVLEYPAADLLMQELISTGSGVFGRYGRA
jgi:hypothetical protein